MQSLLNVPAEVVSAILMRLLQKQQQRKRRIFCPGDHGGCFIAMGASQAVWQSIILRMWELQGPLQDVFSQWDL